MRRPLYTANLLWIASLMACGHTRPQSNNQSPEESKSAQVAGASLSVGVVAEGEERVFLLSRLETTTPSPPIELPEREALYILESDPQFSTIQPLLKSYPTKQQYTLYSAEGSQPGVVSGVAITRAGCAQWAVYPLLSTPQPITKSEVVIARPGEAAAAPAALRIFEPTSEVPGPVRAIIDALPRPKAGTEEKLWARRVELDADEGAELFVARSLVEPLGDQGARAATLEGFWFDESGGAWKIVAQSSLEVAQQDLLRFPRESGWEQWTSPPVLVIDIEGDAITEVVRVVPGGYSLWRFEAGALRLISAWELASKERCD